MRLIISIISVLILIFDSQAQSPADPLSGTYTGFYNGDNISLIINTPSGPIYEGVMKDSYQTYAISLERTGSHVLGTATESSMGLVFEVKGSAVENQLNLNFQILIEGTKAEMDIVFSKSTSRRQIQTELSGTGEFPPNAEHPAALVGTWKKEELYQSGYGDNYMGGGFSQSMTLLANGQVAEGGTNAYISGSDYSGQSSGSASGVIAGVLWYAVGNQLYWIVTQNGVTQTYHLGKYYVEGQSMLITGANGEKVLMQRG